jgi:hypothetical protein
LVHIGSLDLIFELKELEKDDNFDVIKDPARPYIKSSSRTLGDHVRRRIDGSRKQIQYGAKQGIPSILLIYNSLDPVFQMFGTEDMDFTAGMYGEYTVYLNRKTRETSDWFNGKKQLLQENKNTSFGAVGRLCDRGGEITVTLFENVFAQSSGSIRAVATCFDVRRVEVSTEPLVIP